DVPDADIDSNDARQAALGLLHLPIFIATVTVFVIWFYRVHANLEALGARQLTYTSGWAAGCWFVPFLNLVRPVQITQEIWRHSDPNAMTGVGRSGNSGLIGIWWGMWIITSVFSNISARLAWSVNSPETLKTATVVSMFAEITALIAAILALAVVSGIDAGQTARAEAMRTAGSNWEEDA
ncbi:MAG TPA: DUF4328 domain-containing protein, partial [Gemmataceae bacterium]|nr:DUF4328 domain-containing protein [Gemmataceae bacterium]